MRNLYLLFTICAFFATSSLTAQTIVEDSRSMSQGVKNCFTLMTQGLEDGDLEDVLKAFLKDVKSKKSPKWDRRNKEYFVDDATMKQVSSNTVDIYAGYRQTGDLQHEVTVWFDLGGAYLSSEDHPEASVYVSDEMLPALNNAVYNKMVELELEAEQDRFKDMNKDYDKLAKEQKKLEDLIEDCKKKIEQAEKDLKDNAAAQVEMTTSIKDQQEVIDGVKKKMKKN